MSQPQTIYLKDYQQPDFHIETIDLCVELINQEQAVIEATCQIQRQGEHQRPLVLDGEALILNEVQLDQQKLSSDQYSQDETSLTIPTTADRFCLVIKTTINPIANKALSGLYVSNDIFCTQCEAEGFRRLTYFIDRPDNMSIFTCKIIADKARYPILLSNGNPLERGELDGGRHFVLWHDPFKKPSYLFALVAGDLAEVSDTFTTQSGRQVGCHIFVEHGNEGRCDYAMQSLKEAMRWDEVNYGREYDLDIFNIVAVEDFNMGAMENKSLNIFNSKYILADPESATDDDYKGVETVVAHEYFHNWTGNRVTCRDWFQLSLKEGLTVFREQQFSADMNHADEVRINDVRVLRSYQFPEDSGPMAHPVQPASYMEINNFYTMTIYNKGAELNHMLNTLLGNERFRQGADLYFERHDGQAVTINEWVGALADANDIDFSSFMRWYQQAGTPVVSISDHYDAQQKTVTLTLRQSCPATPGQAEKEPFHIPVTVGMLTSTGESMAMDEQGSLSKVIELKEPEMQVSFTANERPLWSLLRGFSAPVKIEYDYKTDDLLKLFAFDVDGFAQWEAGQMLYRRELLPVINKGGHAFKFTHSDGLITALSTILDNSSIDPALKVQLFSLPTFNELAEAVDAIDAPLIVDVTQALRSEITDALKTQMLQWYEKLRERELGLDHTSRSKRSLKNMLLNHLVRSGDSAATAIAIEQYQFANNMTDKFAALNALCDSQHSERGAILQDFYQRWSSNSLVIDKWLSVQARSTHDDVFEHVQQLMQHEAFNLKNPNKVRALLGAFAHGNPKYFHARDGHAYTFYTNQVIAIDQFNPQIAARLLSPFTQWQKFCSPNREQLQAQLERILSSPNVSRDVYEIVSKSLASDKH